MMYIMGKFKKLAIFQIMSAVLCASLVVCDVQKKNEKAFVATKEWQEIEEGQSIPKGLHVRINFATGRKEAKLLDNQFRSYNELKRTMKELNSNTKMEIEIVKELIESYKSAQLISEKERILEDLKYLVHQYDNAVEFVRLGGLDIIFANLNVTLDAPLARDSLQVLSALLQNNKYAKTEALHNGATDILIRVLMFSNDSKVVSSAISSLSALLNSFPQAQLKFVRSGGSSALEKQFLKGANILQLKVMRLITDMLTDFKWHRSDNSSSYEDFPLKEYLVKEGWCRHFHDLFVSVATKDGADEYDILTCVQGMEAQGHGCANEWNRELLSQLQYKYQRLTNLGKEALQEDDNYEHYAALRDLTHDLLYHIHVNQNVNL